jgi:RecA-family ATPase
MMAATEQFGFTYGGSHTQANWGDTRHLSWPKMVEMLTSHVAGPKDGSCIVPAVFTGTQRKKDDAARIDVAFLDSDSGATLDQIRAALIDKRWEAVVSSTHSHMTTETKVSLVNWNRYFSKDPHATPGQFLIDEKGYLPVVADGAEAVASDEVYVHLQHSPCPKFRIAVPLAKPWIAADYPTQAGANAVWKERIEALASALHLSHDQACTDTSRLFYLPRRPPNGAVPETAIVEGSFCDIFALPKVVNDSLFDVHKPNGHANGHADQSQPDRPEFIDPVTGEIIDLAEWAKASGRTFLIAKALRAKRPGVFTGLITDNSNVHIDCPNSDAHTDPSRDAATFVVNAGQATSAKGFIVHCRHGHCTGKDRLFFVRRMLEEHWLSIDDLTAAAFHVRAPEPADGKPEHKAYSDAIPWRAIHLPSWEGVTVPQRRWIVLDWLPVRTVTLCYADGGIGKTLLALQLMAATALENAKWCGIGVEPCNSVGLFSEDDATELHMRMDAIRQSYGASWADLANMQPVDGTGLDNILVRFESDGKMVLTPRFAQLHDEAMDLKARLVVIDTAATCFGGNENDRSQVTQFVGTALTRLAQDIDGAVLLNAHPSLSGLANGDLRSGSTAWNNSCRSRWGMARPETESGQPNLASPERILTRRKSNAAPAGDTITMQWRDGVFSVPERFTAGAGHRKDQAEVAFLAALEAQKRADLHVSANAHAGNYAPKVFYNTPHGRDFSKRELTEAMSNLMKRGRLRTMPYQRNRITHEELVIADI